MFEFKKLCNAFEGLSGVERGILLTEKSVEILASLRALDVPNIDPLETLAGFLIGSVVADGKVKEGEYLVMYPALITTFGYDFPLHDLKEAYHGVLASRKKIAEYTTNLMRLLDAADEELKEAVVTLCLCVTSTDGKISFREKRYIKRLCRA